MSRPDGGTTRRSWLRASLVAPLSGAIAGAASPARPPERRPLDPRERIRDRYLPNVTLRTHDNRSVRFYDDLVKDRIVTINFMYAECTGICPGITMNLGRVQQLLGAVVGREVFMYSVTLQPEHDTPDVLAEYARMHGVRPGWTFLTGEPDAVEHLRQSLGFVDPDPVVDRNRDNHIGNIRYGNEPRMLWGACPGMTPPKWIAESISWMRRPTKSA
jgi:protein SCO1/2